jgi:hypothetical protein
MELPSHHEDWQKGSSQGAAGSMSCITCRKATQREEIKRSIHEQACYPAALLSTIAPSQSHEAWLRIEHIAKRAFVHFAFCHFSIRCESARSFAS